MRKYIVTDGNGNRHQYEDYNAAVRHAQILVQGTSRKAQIRIVTDFGVEIADVSLKTQV